MQEFDIFIGLEIHVQLQTESKMFCSCRNHFGDSQNSNVCPTCLAYPGTLPTPNSTAIEYAYKIAQALRCTLAKTVVFDRKNYYYPDLPKNYQITQFYQPVGREGCFEFRKDGELCSIKIQEAHLEEDAGKLIHSSDSSFCDYNRSGTPLMEIVTEPDIKTPEETEEVLKQFRRMVRFLGVCDGNMEEGSLRCDANISLNKKGAGLGTKVEIKNLNSFRFVRDALHYEIQRQTEALNAGKTIIQETRLWNENRDLSESMRVKEISDDYRFFPEPDIRPIVLPADFFVTLKENQEELPVHRYLRVKEDYGLEGTTLDFFMEEKSHMDYFEAVVKKDIDPSLVANWGIGDVKRLYNRYKIPFGEKPLEAARLAELLKMIQEGQLHGKIAKTVLEKVFEDDADPSEIVKKYEFTETNEDELRGIVETILAQKADLVQQYKEGNTKPFGVLMGQVMKQTGGRANPKLVKTELERQLQA